LNISNIKQKKKNIEVITCEESYTSKCSFLDDEEICKHEKYAGKRVKRGLFRSSNGHEINADINAAYNIARKAGYNFKQFESLSPCSWAMVKCVKFC
jgi:transposase, IS605 orfB family